MRYLPFFLIANDLHFFIASDSIPETLIDEFNFVGISLQCGDCFVDHSENHKKCYVIRGSMILLFDG